MQFRTMQYHNLQGISPVYRTVIRIRKKDAKKELKAVLKLKPSSRGRISAGRPRCPPRTVAGSPGHLQESSDFGSTDIESILYKEDSLNPQNT